MWTKNGLLVENPNATLMDTHEQYKNFKGYPLESVILYRRKK